MMEDFLFQVVDITCPDCSFTNEVLLGQVTSEETIICLGCRIEIQLRDEDGSVRRAEEELRQVLHEFLNLKIDLRL
jgi:hypothetical protein